MGLDELNVCMSLIDLAQWATFRKRVKWLKMSQQFSVFHFQFFHFAMIFSQNTWKTF